jgi:hypothetical protein
VERELDSLVGMAASEVGVHQAWPFVSFMAADASRKSMRLYVDTEFAVTGGGYLGELGCSEDARHALHLLTDVLNRRVVEASVEVGGDLVVEFDGSLVLRVSGMASSWTTHATWWLVDLPVV